LQANDGHYSCTWKDDNSGMYFIDRGQLSIKHTPKWLSEVKQNISNENFEEHMF